MVAAISWSKKRCVTPHKVFEIPGSAVRPWFESRPYCLPISGSWERCVAPCISWSKKRRVAPTKVYQIPGSAVWPPVYLVLGRMICGNFSSGLIHCRALQCVLGRSWVEPAAAFGKQTVLSQYLQYYPLHLLNVFI